MNTTKFVSELQLSDPDLPQFTSSRFTTNTPTFILQAKAPSYKEVLHKNVLFWFLIGRALVAAEKRRQKTVSFPRYIKRDIIYRFGAFLRAASPAEFGAGRGTLTKTVYTQSTHRDLHWFSSLIQ